MVVRSPCAARSASAAVVTLAALLLCARPTWAQPAPPTTDPLLPTGIGFTTAAVAGIAGGVALSASGYAGREFCGYHGCEHAVDGERVVIGKTMIAGSTALGLLGLPLIIQGGVADRYTRHHEGLTLAGVSVTSAGLVTMTSGIAAQIIEGESSFSYPGRSDVTASAITMAAMGGGLVGAGIPMWVAGAREWEPEVRYYDPSDSDAPRNGQPGYVVENDPAMRRAGMGVTVAGILLGATGLGTGVAMAAADSGEYAGLGGLLVGGSLGSGGLVMILIGAPLWAAGGKDVIVGPDDERVREQSSSRADQSWDSWTPKMSVGVGSFELEWTY